jgi:hypothetical protein
MRVSQERCQWTRAASEFVAPQKGQQMKRKTYRITGSNGHVSTKNSWNGSIREIETLVRGIAQTQGTSYQLTRSVSVKDEDGNDHVSGYRIWRGRNGQSVTFHVQRID